MTRFDTSSRRALPALATHLIAIAILAFLACGLAGRALAQACHMPELRTGDTQPFRLATHGAFATYRNASFSGEYQSYGAAASYTHKWVYAETALSGYRIVRNGLADRGLGDLMLDVRGTVLRNDELAVGLELATTLPTGDDQIGLGMGHVMLMPGAWLSYRRNTWSLIAQAAYGRALGSSSSSHHHTATGPIVNPMNRSEVEHAITLGYELSPILFAGARLIGAIPVAAIYGKSREVAGFGLGAHCGPAQIQLELFLPLVGAPFDSKLVLSAAALF